MVSIELIARTVRGVEYVVADEIAALGSFDVTQHPREVRFRANALSVLGALQTPDDIFVLVGSVVGVGHRKDVVRWLGDRARRWHWRSAVGEIARYRQMPASGRFDVVASLIDRRNFSRFDVEDEIGSALSGLLRARYVSRRGIERDMPPVDFTVRVFINADKATFALRLGGTPLHRRDYKQDAAPGTLHPPMAAVLGRLLAPGPGERVLDPFCGDGTIPIEVATMFPQAVVHGADRDPERVRNARANSARADVEVAFTTGDAGRLGFPDGSIDVVISNPPWNITVEATGLLAGGLGRFWSEAERVLSPNGRLGVILDAEPGAQDELRRSGFEVAFAQNVRLAGRLAEIIVCTPADRPDWALPDGIARRRREAVAAGLVTSTGFDSRAGETQ
jgi:23S rRNA G2445 N2-methylase RlmL